MRETAVFHKTREGGAWPARGEKNEMSPLRTVRDTFFKKKSSLSLSFLFLQLQKSHSELRARAALLCRGGEGPIFQERDPFFPRHPSQPHFSRQKKGKIKKIRNLHRRPVSLLFSSPLPLFCVWREGGAAPAPPSKRRRKGKGREGFQASQSAARL